jgi:hypothetical protein
MRTDNKGCSTCKPGQEQYETYTSGGVTYYQYDYRHHDGELFSTIKRTIEACREARDEWIKEKIGQALIEDLTLLLLYLTGWTEQKRNPSFEGETIFRAWKAYKFEVLNDLEEQHLVRQFRTSNSRSLLLTEAGIKKAIELSKKLGAVL